VLGWPRVSTCVGYVMGDVNPLRCLVALPYPFISMSTDTSLWDGVDLMEKLPGLSTGRRGAVILNCW
jgi:hypothetical protein